MKKKEVKAQIAELKEFAEKQTEQLYAVGGWNVISNKVYKIVIPRIVNDAYEKAFVGVKKKPDVKDIAFLYGILVNFANTNELNDYKGAAWVSLDNLAKLMRVSRNRIGKLSNILEANGLIKTIDFYEGTTRRKLYYPIHFTKVSEDGYIVNGDGEKVVPCLDVYKGLIKNSKKRE